MAYTEFRKSYGDFEVVIPAVDFSILSKEEAKATATRLRTFTTGFVCHHLGKLAYRGELHSVLLQKKAVSLIDDMLINSGGCQLGEGHLSLLVRNSLNLDDNYFRAFHADGDELRKAWCDHMASEIEREFNLKGG